MIPTNVKRQRRRKERASRESPTWSFSPWPFRGVLRGGVACPALASSALPWASMPKAHGGPHAVATLHGIRCGITVNRNHTRRVGDRPRDALHAVGSATRMALPVRVSVATALPPRIPWSTRDPRRPPSLGSIARSQLRT